MTHTVCFENYELQVEVTRCLVVPPNPATWDSDLDYYGYSEMEFDVVSGISYDEFGDNPKDISLDECKTISDQYAETIEEKLWDQIDSENGDY